MASAAAAAAQRVRVSAPCPAAVAAAAGYVALPEGTRRHLGRRLSQAFPGPPVPLAASRSGSGGARASAAEASNASAAVLAAAAAATAALLAARRPGQDAPADKAAALVSWRPVRCEQRRGTASVGSRYVDDGFPAGDASMGRTRFSFRPEWRRVGDLHGLGRLRLFGDGAGSSGSVCQGALGDCWLLGVFACVAEFPGHVEALFEQQSLQPEGRYAVFLFNVQEHRWRRIEVDDQVPCFPKPGFLPRTIRVADAPCFCKPSNGEVWPLILEKACAKAAGSYGALEGGYPEFAFQLLTGQPEQLRWIRTADGRWHRYRFVAPRWNGANMADGATYERTRKAKTLEADDFFLRLAYYDQANFLLSASIDAADRSRLEHRRRDGLVEGHAYSVLEVQEIHGVRLVRLRNPWGRVAWNGDWSAGSAQWRRRPDVAADASRIGIDDGGSFWMSFEDFTSTFKSVMVCPATMPVPKSSRYAHVTTSSRGSEGQSQVTCGRCSKQMRGIWLLTVSDDGCDANGAAEGGIFGRFRGQGSASRRRLEWVRLRDGDLCPLCLRATAPARRALRAGGGVAGSGVAGSAAARDNTLEAALSAEGLRAAASGRHGTELRRKVPGVDYFPFEAGAGALLPTARPCCELGPSCTVHDPRHHAAYDHPWMRPGPELVLKRGSGR